MRFLSKQIIKLIDTWCSNSTFGNPNNDKAENAKQELQLFMSSQSILGAEALFDMTFDDFAAELTNYLQ